MKTRLGVAILAVIAGCLFMQSGAGANASEFVAIDDLLASAKVMALAAAELLGAVR